MSAAGSLCCRRLSAAWRAGTGSFSRGSTTRLRSTVGARDRAGRFLRVALMSETPLQELVDQRLAPPVQLAFESALTHLLSLGRRQEGFGLREDAVGRRIQRRRISHPTTP